MLKRNKQSQANKKSARLRYSAQSLVAPAQDVPLPDREGYVIVGEESDDEGK
jgi:hypothetical protein